MFDDQDLVQKQKIDATILDNRMTGAIAQEFNISILQGYKYGNIKKYKQFGVPKGKHCYSALKTSMGARWRFQPATYLQARKHYSTYKLVWKSMNSNRKICIIVHRTITERVALLYNRTLLFHAQGLNRGQNGDFGLLHSSWAWKHYSTYILVWKSMKSNREICIIAHRAIIERITLLYSRIMLFADGDLVRYCQT